MDSDIDDSVDNDVMAALGIDVGGVFIIEDGNTRIVGDSIEK